MRNFAKSDEKQKTCKRSVHRSNFWLCYAIFSVRPRVMSPTSYQTALPRDVILCASYLRQLSYYITAMKISQ